jgi:hypothetical protein
MEQSEFYQNGFSDRMNGVQYRAPSMSQRLADSPWNDYDRGWADAQRKIQEQSTTDTRKFLND